MNRQEISDYVNSRSRPMLETDDWDSYWSNVKEPLYNDAYLSWLKNINCTEYHNLLFEDFEFFNRIQKYMESVGWSYHSSDKTPTISKLMNSVLDLSYSSGTSSGIECSTGGFTVWFQPKQYLKIAFSQYHSEDIIFYKEILKTDIRELKLKKILHEEVD